MLQRRGMLLDSTTRLLVACASEGREFTPREQDGWDWASAKVDELGANIAALAADLGRRRYGPVIERRGEIASRSANRR